MLRETINRQSLLALVADTLSKFPPRKDSGNVRPFRLISVDYLEGRITHSQFGLLYTLEKTAEQITDGILGVLHDKQVRRPVNTERMGDAPPKKWHL
jgi:hypothetical protein